MNKTILFIFMGLLCSSTFSQENHQLTDTKAQLLKSKNINRLSRHNQSKNSHKFEIGDRDIPINTFNGQSPNEKQIEIVKNVFIEDFLVNDDTTGGADQMAPTIAMDFSGNFVIVWSDGRNGYYDIFYQRYNASGLKQGVNTKANEVAGMVSSWITPPITMDGSGNFVIVWLDGRNGNSDIYYQRYNVSGVAQGVNTKANDDAGTSAQYYPSIAMDGSGNFVIVWEDYRDGNSDIYYQRYDTSGAAQGVNTKANDDAGTVDQEFPSIAIDDNGNFVIVWMDGRNGNYYDIYYQRYNSSGAKQGVNTKANDVVAGQWYPSIAMDGSGNFVIVWMEDRTYNNDIYYQRYNESGAAQGVNTKANDDAGTADQWNPSIAMDGSGNFVIVWSDGRNGNYDIYYQSYDTIGAAQGVNTKVNNDAGTAWQSYPSIAVDSSRNFVIVWVDYRNGNNNDDNSDIYYQRYNSSGIAQGVNTKANDDAGAGEQGNPSIEMDSSGNFVIVWDDYRNGNSDIFYQCYNASGAAQGVNTKANDDAGTAGQYSPSIALDSSGNFVIVWADYRNSNNDSNFDIYYQRYNSIGIAQGVNTKANDDAGTEWQGSPSIAMDGSGNFVIVWEDERNGGYTNSDIYYQRYNSSGIAQGVNTKANADAGTADQGSPSIAMDISGNFVIVWYDYRNVGFDIYYQRYITSGVAQGVNMKANDVAGSVSSWAPPSVAMGGSGNFVIVWDDNRNGSYYFPYNIYYQRYNTIGAAQGVNTKANDDAGMVWLGHPSTAMDSNGNFVIVWTDYRYSSNYPDVIGQRYYADGSLNGINYRIVADGPNYGEENPVVAANNNSIVFAWMDNRRSKGWDIFAKKIGWDWNGIPVELTSFAAIVNETDVTLNWSTATETNNLGFEVQREMGNEFIKIGYVKGNGTTTQTHQYSYLDKELPSGSYSYRLRQVDYNGVYEFSKIIEVYIEVPKVFSLEQNFPNPFNPSTKISWQSPISSWQTLKVYDILGNKVATLVDEYKPAGKYEAEFKASDLSSGLYIYILNAGNYFSSRKMLLLK